MFRYRELDVVQHWIDEAEVGNYDIDWVEGCLAEMATYVLAGELALGEVLAGDLPRPEFPAALRQVAPDAGGPARPSRSISLIRPRGTTTLSRARGCLRRQPSRSRRRRSRSAASGVLTEKGIVRGAGLGGRVEGILAAPGDRAFVLGRAVTAMRAALGIPPGAHTQTA